MAKSFYHHFTHLWPLQKTFQKLCSWDVHIPPGIGDHDLLLCHEADASELQVPKIRQVGFSTRLRRTISLSYHRIICWTFSHLQLEASLLFKRNSRCPSTLYVYIRLYTFMWPVSQLVWRSVPNLNSHCAWSTEVLITLKPPLKPHKDRTGLRDPVETCRLCLGIWWRCREINRSIFPRLVGADFRQDFLSLVSFDGRFRQLLPILNEVPTAGFMQCNSRQVMSNRIMDCDDHIAWADTETSETCTACTLICNLVWFTQKWDR